MKQLISNLLMQPKPDAVERLTTLIEKLEQQRDSYFKYHKDYGHKDSEMRGWGVEKAIEIIEEHSDWVAVSERLPTECKHCLAYDGFRYFVTTFYPEIQKFCTFHDNIEFWQPIQPPSEVQDD